MKRVDFAAVKLAQAELREALHGIDALGARRPSEQAVVNAADIDRILEHLEAAILRLRGIRQSTEAER
jgi:hypothetical protein